MAVRDEGEGRLNKKGDLMKKHVIFLAVLTLAFLAGFWVEGNTAQAQEAVCAQVKLEIQQELTLERSAFDARMTIRNGLIGFDLTEVGVTVTVTDADGQDASSLFFVDVFELSNISDVSGTGTVAAESVAEIHWLIIPSPGAGGDSPEGQVYNVGATLEYVLKGGYQLTEVVPDAIVVKPQPLLVLDYFNPRFVMGDDPFTPETEPSVPYTLGVRVKNGGYGTARNLAIDSSQPVIKENELGLLIDFELLNSYVNDEPVNNTLLVNFGDIDPGESKVARWNAISSLLGEYVSFEAEFTHSDELGGELTSLIQDVHAHVLIHDVLIDLPGKDSVKDFLALDGDTYRVYGSDGVDEEATAYLPGGNPPAVSGAPSEQDPEITLSFPETAGPVYAKVSEPADGDIPIACVVRSDGKTLSPDNYWISMERDGEHNWYPFVNIFDYNSNGTYTVQYNYGGSGGTIELTPGHLNFTDVLLGHSLVREANVSNTGDGDLAVTNIYLGAGTDIEFSIISCPSLPLNLAPGASESISVRYTPSGYSWKNGVLVVESDDKNVSGTLFGSTELDEDNDGIPSAILDENGQIMDVPPCIGGNTENCVDNAPGVYNPDQADKDGDGIGDVIDGCDGRYEPNDNMREATEVSGQWPFETIETCIDWEDDVDFYTFRALAGSRVEARIQEETTDDGLDTVMGLFDPCGVLIYFNDDNGESKYSALHQVPLPITGDYYLAISSVEDYGFQGANGLYQGHYTLYLDVIANSGDFDGDGDCDGTDLTIFSQAYGSYEGDDDFNADCDLSDDKQVDSDDLTLFADFYGDAPPEPSLLGDVDKDGDLDGVDIAAFAASYGTLVEEDDYDADCDFNNDGAVNKIDLAILATNFGRMACTQ